MDLKELLGSAYKEGMSETDIADAFSAIMTQMTDKHTTEVNSLKTNLSKANSESADYKRQIKARMSEEEQKEAERSAELQKLIDRNKELERQFKVSELSTKFTDQGYTSELAKKTAEAMYDGDYESVLKHQATFLTEMKKNFTDAQIKGTPRPVGGNETQVIDYSSKISEAMSRGDTLEAAMYARMQSEANIKE